MKVDGMPALVGEKVIEARRVGEERPGSRDRRISGR